MIDTLRTQRLILRRWRESDLSGFAALNADPRVCEYLPKTLDRAESDALAERIDRHFATEGFGFWAIEIPGETRFAGFTGLARVRFAAPFVGTQAPPVEIGWRLAAAYWGRGIATEAARAARDAAFGALGLDSIVAFTVPANRRSRAVMERIGMRHDPDQDFDHPALPPGHHLRRHVLYRMDRQQWRTVIAACAT